LREEKLVILLFFAYQFFRTCFFIYAVDKLFFLRNGITLFQIAILVSLWSGMCLLLGIPAGILADRWNRRYMLILSGLFYSLAFLVWYKCPTFAGICLGYLFNSLGCTFGAMQSYLYDMLAHYQKTHMFEQIWGWGYAWNAMGFAVALGFGGILSEFSYTLPLIGSIFSGVLMLLIGFLLPDFAKLSPVADDAGMWKFLKNSVRSAFSQTAILNAFLFTAVVRSSYAVLDEYWSVYFNVLGISNALIGILMAAASALGGLASLFAYRLKTSAWKTVNIFSVFIGTVVLLAGFAKSWVMVVAFLSLEMAICVTVILVDGIIQKNVAKEGRATICSINALCQDVQLISGIIFGYLLQEFGISFGYGFLGIFVLSFSFLQCFVPKKRECLT
jgi:MFS family permease